MKNFILFIICALTFFSCQKKESHVTEKRDLTISEVMAWNLTGLRSPQGKPVDWLEIKNNSSDSTDIEGLILEVIKSKENITDSLKIGKKYRLPSFKIPPGGYLIVYCSKHDTTISENKKYPPQLGADIKLPKEGAVVRLVDSYGEVVNEVNYPAMQPDISFELKNDGSYGLTSWPSPGFDNSEEGCEQAIDYIDCSSKGPLLIWEVFNRGNKVTDNWVELKNTGDSVVDLADYSLARKEGKEVSWNLPQKKLPGGQFIVIQLAGKKANPYNPGHSTLKLGKHETLVLLKNGIVEDAVNARSTITGGSIGRKIGSSGFFYFEHPSRGTENLQKGFRRVAMPPKFDLIPGIYPEKEKITLRLANEGHKVRYTLDGSNPTKNSPLFNDSLILDRSMTVRAFDQGDSLNLHSNISTSSFLLGPEHQIPVINITVNNADLYDYYTGIYAEGPGYTDEWPHYGANFWKNWTKKAHVEFFEPGKEGFSIDCGIKIFGGFSRYEAKKSFQLKLSEAFGIPKLTYDFFDTGVPMEVEDLVLRSGAQDYNRCMLRDEFFTSLLGTENSTLLTQLYRPVALYINTGYFGLYYLREKIDRHFIARKLNLPSDSIDIIVAKGLVENGSNKAYNHILNFLTSNDMSKDENFEYAKRHIDLQGLIDHKLGEIYSGNTDVGNVRYALSSHSESDGKWRFVFYDLDATWTGDKPGVEYYLAAGADTGENSVGYHNRMIASLLRNPQFRDMFLQRLSYHLSNTFSTENATSVFDNMVDQIRPEMQLNCQRWPQLSYKQWEKNVEAFREKFKTRPQVILNDIRRYLKVTPEENKKYFSQLGY